MSTSEATARKVQDDRDALRARHRRGIELVSHPDPVADFCAPDFDRVPDGRPPEVTGDALSAPLLRAAILGHGCLLVRGLVDPDEASRLVSEVEHGFEARTAHHAGTPRGDGLYEPFAPDPGYRPLWERGFVETVGIWTVDSPVLAARVFGMLERARLREVMAEYLGEEPVLAVNKCTLRRAEGGPPGPWHQDGAFLGDVRTANVWLALTPCGEDSPSLDVVAQRVGHILETGTEGADHNWSLAPDVAEGAAGEEAVVRLHFEPGDALLFDDRCVHRPGSDESMTRTRYAVETWFFGPAGFPGDYTPVAL